MRLWALRENLGLFRKKGVIVASLNAKEYTTFESIKQSDESSDEFWYARELAVALQYKNWQNFAKVIDRAVLACKNSGYAVSDHFIEVSKMVAIGSGAQRKQTDYKLSRYACYLIVQNGDPRKEVIALGQTYFAIQTRRTEVADAFNQLDENNKRLVARGDIRQWNQLLAEAAHSAGIITNDEYAIFQNAGYKGLYGGLTVADIHKHKGLEPDEKILDFMGSTELIANLFRISQTEEKLRLEDASSPVEANNIHYEVAEKIRNAIKEMGATLPENLPTPTKSIQVIEREEIRKLRESKTPLMLDE
jgi:DNA-damage-inducible protein D